MLINNRRLLQTKNNLLLQKELNSENNSCEIIESKSGTPTLLLNKDGQKISYHSRYNPLQEAKKFLEDHITSTTEYVLFIGTGLGYSIQHLKTDYPNVKFSIYEPDLDVMSCFLDNFDLTKVRTKNLDYIFNDPKEEVNIAEIFDHLTSPHAKILIHPVTARLYEKEVGFFTEGLKNYLNRQKYSITTDLRFQSRWVTNAIVNFKDVLQSPNIFKDIEIEKLKNKPALLIAAGPSLDEEIENIRYVKGNGKAYVFAVGSAVNTLIQAGIVPDALFSYDPSEKNAKVVEKIKELGLSIPLIFGSSIGYEVLKDYPGQKLHFLTGQDSISKSLIQESMGEIISDAPTIAAVTLNILGTLGMGPIILVGQNLSITKEKSYASGIDYVRNSLNAKELKKHTVIESTTGREVYVTQVYLDMRTAMETIIRNLNISDRVINTTNNGLPIEGANYLPFTEVLETYLKKNQILEPNIFEATNSYEIANAMNNFQQLEGKFDLLLKNFKKVLEVENQIREAYESKIFTNREALFAEYDKYFGEVENNEFFVRILSKVSKVQYNQLLKDARKIRTEKRPLQKMKLFLDSHSKYLRTLYVAIFQIQPAFAELKKSDLFKKEDSQ